MVTLPKWQTPRVHPVAERLPMMSDAEIAELAADIEANGLLEPIILWEDNREAANGATGPFTTWLLDGRNRLAALELLGITDPNRAPRGPKTADKIRRLYAMGEYSNVSISGGGVGRSGWKVDVDPTVYVLSANVRRRHLSSEQKRQAIEAYIKADPTASNRKVASALGVSHPAVAEVRGGPNGKTFQTDHLPTERAKAALRTDSTLTKRALMAAADVGSSVAVKARKELEAAGEIQPKPSTTTPSQTSKPRAKAKPKPAAPQNVTLPTSLIMTKLRKNLIAFSEDQIGQLVDIDGAPSADIADYVAAVDQIAVKLKAAANAVGSVEHKVASK